VEKNSFMARMGESRMEPTWKTPRKKFRKWSNISVKKYHHIPMLGARSDTVRLHLHQLLLGKDWGSSRNTPCLGGPRHAHQYKIAK